MAWVIGFHLNCSKSDNVVKHDSMFESPCTYIVILSHCDNYICNKNRGQVSQKVAQNCLHDQPTIHHTKWKGKSRGSGLDKIEICFTAYNTIQSFFEIQVGCVTKLYNGIQTKIFRRKVKQKLWPSIKQLNNGTFFFFIRP